jgi:predicted ester cyclase
MASDLDELASRYAKAWSSQDPGSVAGFFAEGGSLEVNDGAPAVGRAAVAEVAKGFMTAFPDLVVTMDRLVRNPLAVEFHWTLTGTNSGPGGSGKRVRISGYEEWRIDADGLIAESKGHFDASEYERQLEHGVDASSGHAVYMLCSMSSAGHVFWRRGRR